MAPLPGGVQAGSTARVSDGVYLWYPKDDWAALRGRNASWMWEKTTTPNSKEITRFVSDHKTGEFLGKSNEVKLEPGKSYDLWDLVPKTAQQGTRTGVGGVGGAGSSGNITYWWKHITTTTPATGPGTVSGSENSDKGRNAKPGGKAGAGKDKDKAQDANFVNTEGWAIMSNAPMLSVNYPDKNFLELQTDPYVSRVVKGQAVRKNATVQGSGKGYSSGSKGKAAAVQSSKPTKRKRKVSHVEGQLPSNKVRLGYLEQDIYLHSDLASNQKIKSAQKAKKDQKSGYSDSHRWRFKFHYNPANVVVSQSYNTELDPLFIAKDPAASIQSGSSVSFELWINRIEEMQILNHDGSLRLGSGNVDDDYVRWAWRGGKVSKQTRSLIRTMGTQYDLEYLYRVANGDPLDTWKGLSADYGILFGQPLRLHFTAVKNNGMNVGMNYYGFISSLSIDHKMFSMDMVPSLTHVQVEFTRIPDTLAMAPNKLGEAFAR